MYFLTRTWHLLIFKICFHPIISHYYDLGHPIEWSAYHMFTLRNAQIHFCEKSTDFKTESILAGYLCIAASHQGLGQKVDEM